MGSFSQQLEYCFRNMNSNLDGCIPFWDIHRKNIRDLINVVLEMRKDSDNSLIIGAGNCYDIPLEVICNAYIENDLLDIDEQTLIRTKEYCNEEFYNKISLIKKDITGVNETEADELLRYLTFKQYDKAESILLKWIQEELCSSEVIGSNYSLVISSTVSSQLLLPLIQTIEQAGNDRLITLAKKLGDRLAEKHFSQIVGSLKNDCGIGVVTSEQYAWGRLPDGRYLPLSHFIDVPESMLDVHKQLEIENYGGPFIINGRISFEKIIREFPEIRVISQKQWIWRFTENIYYLVKGLIFEKNVH